MAATGWLRRHPAWVDVGLIVAGLLLFRYAMRAGETGLAVLWAAGTLLTVWRLIRRPWLDRHPRDWTQIWTSTFRFNLGCGIVSLGLAAAATVSAVAASGSDRIVDAVYAAVLYAFGTFFALGAVGFHRYRSGRPLGRLSWVFYRPFRRGCSYCADDSNLSAGNLEQLAGGEALQGLLVKCPRCGWHYLLSPHGPKQTVHVTDRWATARVLN
jgi:hypothetical protein